MPFARRVLSSRRALSYCFLSLAATLSPLPLAFAQDSSAAQGQSWQANDELVAKRMKDARGFNYIEDRVPEFSLPESLRASDGSRIESAQDWNQRRRPELLELFRENVYGRRPTTAFRVEFIETDRILDAFDGTAIGRSMQAVVHIDARTFRFPFVVFVPTQVETPAPAVVLINNRYRTPLEKAATEEDPFWPVKTLIEKGYATASFHTSDVDPDNKDGYADGIRSFFAGQSTEPKSEDAWRCLSSWGWGASRLLDYLETQPAVDASRIAVVGHSRGGKAALWAAAEDERFAIAYSNDSGCGGAALSRRQYGETVQRITTAFPHWFCNRFASYSDDESKCPVDQHQLIALIAPRSVYVASADEDLWADPRGEYQSVVEARDVYSLLGESSISEPAMPPLGKPRYVGKTGYHIRSGEHNLTQVDWDYFLDFLATTP